MSTHHYHITVTEQTVEQTAEQNDPIAFDVKSHDDLEEIIQRVAQLNVFTPDDVKVFAVSVKLFGGVLLQYKNHPLFAEFAPHFGEFMRHIKGKSKR